MTTSTASDAIATLIDLAEQGEINPWDVSVIEVIDRFLLDSGIFQSFDLAYQQRNLPRSGQAFLWASMLVRFKADTLESLGDDPEEVLPLLEELIEGANLRTLPLHLEQHLRRRTASPPMRRRRVTLQELINQIQEIAVEIEKTESTKTPKRSRTQSRRKALQIITELAHQENLTELANQLEQFLQSQLAELRADESWIELGDLLNIWHQHQAPLLEEQKQDKVGVFWALLLLSSQSKVELSQDEFYQDLKIQVI
jgi:segregation and condensation protein A